MLSPQKEHLPLERECYLQVFRDVRDNGPAKFKFNDLYIHLRYSLPLLLNHFQFDVSGIFQCLSEGYFRTSQRMYFWFISLKQNVVQSKK